MRVLLAAFGVMAIVACNATDPAASSREASATLTSSPSAAEPRGIAQCADVPLISAPPERYRDSPIYVGNPPTEELRSWAMARPGFETLWIDRQHNGWMTLAFSEEADLRQAELEHEFPGLGAVVVSVDWTMSELRLLQQEISRSLPAITHGSGILENKGVVSVYIGVLAQERIDAVENRFPGEPICVEGADPADFPSAGPQARAGDGWRLLGDGDGVGPPYRTGIAWDESSYSELWRVTQLAEEPPPVDFESELVIWFGVVTGSMCPPIRMDDVLVDAESALVYPEIVHVGFGACTDDIHPHAYVVALDRDRLPAAPFTIGLEAEGRLGDRTIVQADLSVPGSVPRSGEVRNDGSRPDYVPGPGAIVEPGYDFEYRQTAHCGLEWLGPINWVNWRTADADGPGWIPDRWHDAVEDGELTVTAIIRDGDPPRLFATAAGHTVMYEATPDQRPGCD